MACAAGRTEDTGGKGAGDGTLGARRRGRDLSFVGVAKGFERELCLIEREKDGEEGERSRCLPLFLTGEKGLEVRRGAEDLTARDLGRIDFGGAGADEVEVDAAAVELVAFVRSL